jgi:drug/metabolite transporter (DMT)-like permease
LSLFSNYSEIIKNSFQPKSRKTNFWIGVIIALFAAIFASTINVVGKTLVDPSYGYVEDAVHPLNLAIFLGLIAGLFFTPFSKGKKFPKKSRKKALFFVMMLGVTDVLAITTNFFGLHHTTAINATILINTELLFSVIIALTIFRERIEKKETLPLCLITVGAIILPLLIDILNNNSFETGLVFGDFMIILAASFFAIDISIARYVSNLIPATKISQISAFAGIPFALLLMAIFQVPFQIPFDHFPSIIYMGIFVSGLSYFFFIIALKLIGAIRTVLIYSTTTIFGILFSGIFLGEQITSLNIISVIVISSGVYFLRNKFAKMEN